MDEYSDVDMSGEDHIHPAVQRHFDTALRSLDSPRVMYLLEREPRLLMVPFENFIDSSNVEWMIPLVKFMFRNKPTYADYLRKEYSFYFETRGTDSGAPPSEVPDELIDHIRQLFTPDDQEEPQGEEKRGENDGEYVTPEEWTAFLDEIDDDDMTGGYTAYPGFTGLTGK